MSVNKTDADSLVSVIMPCYNAAPFINESIDSVLSQTHENVQLIIVDDGSTDGSNAIIKKLAEACPEKICLIQTSHIGAYPARNTGLKHAKGNYIAFLDADDLWLPDTITKLFSAMTLSKADIVYCGWQNVGEGIKANPYIPPVYEEDDIVTHFVRTCPWPIHAALVKREIVNQLGGFSERRFSSMDYDFWLRALTVTRRIKRVPEVLAFYRWHNQGQISAVKWRQVQDAFDAQLAFIQQNPGLVSHISKEKLRDLTEGQLLRQAYRALWKRDLESAQKLFRSVMTRGAFSLSDLKYVATALLPMALYRGLTRLIDKNPT